MFGRRPDGRRLYNIDPIVRLMPYIMVQRTDASNRLMEYVDYEPMANYVRARSKEGKKISFMALVMAAYVRACNDYPAINRFIVNKQVFARKEIVVSLSVLRPTKEFETDDEALCKMHFKPDNTLDEVNDILSAQVEAGKDSETDNSTVEFASLLLKIPLLVNVVAALAKFLDRYGLAPKWLLEISPFHCGMYLTNMASLGMPALYHHLYNFGNTTIFLAMGKPEKQPVFTSQGVSYKTVLPLGITTDERICGGKEYSLGFARLRHYLAHPEELEVRPDHVNSEYPGKKKA